MANNGILVNGLFLSSQTPQANQRGLLIDRKFFIPLVEGGGGTGDIEVGVLVDDSGTLKYQPLSFNGTTPSDTGVLEAIGTPKIFNTGKNEPAYAGGVTPSTPIPTDGLYFYAPLAEDASAAITGQALSKSGTITYQTIDGVPCSYFDGTSSISISNITTMATSDWSVSCWCKSTGGGANVKHARFWCIGSPSDWCNISSVVSNNTLAYNIGGETEDPYFVPSVFTNIMHNIIVTYTGGTLYIYVDKVLVASKTGPTPTSSSTFYIGDTGFLDQLIGFVGALRIYNRALTQHEISALYNEFN